MSVACEIVPLRALWWLEAGDSLQGRCQGMLLGLQKQRMGRCGKVMSSMH